MVQVANSQKSGVVFIKKRLYYYENTQARIIKPSKKESEIWYPKRRSPSAYPHVFLRKAAPLGAKCW